MLVSKHTAQNKATDTANQIAAHGGASCTPPALQGGVANTGSPPLLDQITLACSEYQADNSDVNTDATIGNIAIGVGAVAAVGTLIYWFVADRKGESPSTGSRPIVTPIVGRSEGGFALSGSF